MARQPIFDEMRGFPGDDPRPSYARVDRWLSETDDALLQTRRAQAEGFFRRIGITFAVYGDDRADERLIPFDIVPRIITRTEWQRLERGLIQRVTALNAFLADIYGKREILAAGVIPEELVLLNPQYQLGMIGFRPPGGVYTHISGIDIVRTGPDDFYVLEDNVRTPSGVSYMLENREVMFRLHPELFARHRVAPVEDYPDLLADTLRSVAPDGRQRAPTIAVLTPGYHNSAFYEHSFLADKMGVELVEGDDLFVRDDIVYMRTTAGPRQVDVIYRRIDDAFIDPLAFRPDSVLGVPGLMSAYHAGNVTLANAAGTGIADDKAVYSYLPEIIRFYTGEDALLPNVPTYRCREPDALAYTLDNLADLVVKEVDGSGGYGMLVGPHATAAQIDAFAGKLRADPAKFIAQPTLALSTCPTLGDDGIGARHVDLRPYVLMGADGITVVPGGLTRVALTEGSLVVNSSQGGGTKDTWVIDG
ncbi:putative circularly permuted ATP-grasp superfamily protein [Sphingomonas jejuensis]|uniref:Circularly permuted ATP-grasp superfamily protein n=1 Tax=Sphingomonas jejuensis TaxID=904715 RepID=A0ABX0XKW3_9SPHN|nr:putative circularly permuted ATP-grasp superfamily protein [Sphingomonas jejuensis]